MGRIPNLNITGLRRAIPITTSIVAMKMPERMNIRRGKRNAEQLFHRFTSRPRGRPVIELICNRY